MTQADDPGLKDNHATVGYQIETMLDGVKTHIIQKKIRKIIKPYSVQCTFSNVSKLVTKEKEDVKR